VSKAHDLGNAFGFLFPEEIELLEKIAKELPAKAVVINIGAGVGTSSLTLAEQRADLKIYTVDISPGGPHGGLQNEVNAFANANLSGRLPTQVLGDSSAVGRSWSRGPADLVIIDGDHSDRGVRADIAAWLPHVKPGGLVAFHDYERDVWPAVQLAVDELLTNWPVYGHARTLKVFRAHG
jgi:predicted O-methyltransferase YrrM